MHKREREMSHVEDEKQRLEEPIRRVFQVEPRANILLSLQNEIALASGFSQITNARKPDCLRILSLTKLLFMLK